MHGVARGAHAAGAALDGKFAGGDRVDIEIARPLVSCLADRFLHMGDNGTGQTTKMCNQVMVMNTFVTMAEMLKLAENGGVVGIYLMPFLNPSGPPSAAHVLAHIEHALDVCGEDHVGIGSDQGIVPLDVGGAFTARFEEVSRQRTAAGIAAPREDTIPYVPDLNHPRRLETIADHMSARGHASRVIEKVLGANFMRLFEEVWG